MEDLSPRPVWDFATYAPLVPSRGWIRDYLAYAIQCTDAPPLYHILTGIGGVSLVISPDHVLVVFGEEHPLHLFIMIVGESGNRKSAAIKRCLKVIHPCLARQQLDHRVWYPEASSVEGIFDGLLADPCRLMVASEWTDLHNMHKANYAQHAREFFNLLYDGMPLTRLKMGNQMAVPKPCVSILGASTPGLVRGATNLHDWEAGKLARYLIGYQSKPEECEMIAAIEHPKLVVDLQVNYDMLMASSLSNAFVLSQEAWECKVGWERGEQWRDFRRGLPEHLQPSALRVSEHLYRIATIYQASMTYPHEMVVSEEAMWAAINLVWYCMQSAQEAFGLLSSDEKNPVTRVLQVVRMFGRGGVDHRELLRRSRLQARQLNEALETLRLRGEIHTAAVRGAVKHYYRQPPTTLEDPVEVAP
jgi:hypothetical protein